MASKEQEYDDTVSGVNEFEDSITGYDDDVINEDDSRKSSSDEEDYGRRVQKRISKEVAKTHAERARAEQLQRELALERQLRVELEDKYTKASNTGIDALISNKTSEKIILLETGDFSGAAKLDDEIIDLKVRKIRVDDFVRTVPTPPANVAQTTQVNNSVPEAQQKWLEENDWFFNPNKADLKQKADAVYLKLINEEGFDSDEPETYAELNKRIGVNKPTQSRQGRGNEEPAPTGLSPDRGNAIGRQDSVPFSSSDAAEMRRYGLDPNNPKARKAWIAESKGN
jgi:hypothetical protein